jgi:hypothetical protein
MNDNLLKNLVKAQMSATVQTQILDELNRMRQTKPIVFIRTLLMLARANHQQFLLFVRQFELTNDELALLLLESGKAKGQTEKDIIKEVKQIISEAEELTPKNPTYNELFADALKALRSEKSNWTKRDFLNFAEKRIEKYFEKNPKVYTDEQVTETAKWYNQTRKKLLQKKQELTPRSRSRVNVPAEEWEITQQRLFDNKRPEFARQFQKEVRAKAAELRNAGNAQNSVK